MAFKLVNEDGMWQQVLRKKYLRRKTITQVERRPDDSQFWTGIMRIKEQFFQLGRFRIQNGTQTRFWEDVWLGPTPLKLQYPNLYNITHRKNKIVAEVVGFEPPNVEFRRTLHGLRAQEWQELTTRLTEIHLNEEPDVFIWLPLKSGLFSVKSMYEKLLDQTVLPMPRFQWKVKIPLKIKVFLWFMHKGVTLTKDNLAKKNWKGCMKCCYCNYDENIHHLFFHCNFAKYIWRIIEIAFGLKVPQNVTHIFGNWLDGVKPAIRQMILVGVAAILWAIWLNRNDVIFNNATISSPMQVIYRSTYWMRFWSLLQKKGGQLNLKAACLKLEIITMELFARNGWRFSNRIEC